MKIYFATDHAGYEMKEVLIKYVRDELGYEVEDMGAHRLDSTDDYTDFVHKAAGKVSSDPANSRAIVLGASGQGEAIVANRHSEVRAVVYYGEPTSPQVDASGKELGMIESTREHNDANVLSLGARFLTMEEARRVVKLWLSTEFTGQARHSRRISKIDNE